MHDEGLPVSGEVEQKLETAKKSRPRTKSPLLTIEQVAWLCQVDVTTVRRWIYNKMLEDVIGLPSHKDPNRHLWRIPRRSLAKMLGIDEHALSLLLA